MRIHLLLSCASLMLVAVLGINDAVAANAKGDDAVSTVVRLYKNYAWEAVFVSPWSNSDSLFYAPPNDLRKYFDESLVQLLLKDRSCGEAICNLDFTPIWNSKDSLGASVVIKATDDPAVVVATVTYPNGSTDLRYYMKRGNKGWRIADIKSPAWSLVSILTGPTH